jgi:hypothetical protein
MRCDLLVQQEQHPDWFGKVSTNVDNGQSARQPMTKFVHSRQVTDSSSHSYGRIGDDSRKESRGFP